MYHEPHIWLVNTCVSVSAFVGASTIMMLQDFSAAFCRCLSIFHRDISDRAGASAAESRMSP